MEERRIHIPTIQRDTLFEPLFIPVSAPRLITVSERVFGTAVAFAELWLSTSILVSSDPYSSALVTEFIMFVFMTSIIRTQRKNWKIQNKVKKKKQVTDISDTQRPRLTSWPASSVLFQSTSL